MGQISVWVLWFVSNGRSSRSDSNSLSTKTKAPQQAWFYTSSWEITLALAWLGNGGNLTTIARNWSCCHYSLCFCRHCLQSHLWSFRRLSEVAYSRRDKCVCDLVSRPHRNAWCMGGSVLHWCWTFVLRLDGKHIEIECPVKNHFDAKSYLGIYWLNVWFCLY